MAHVKRERGAGERGLGVVEILIVLAVVAAGAYLLLRYMGSTVRSVETLQQERPIAAARLLADQATLAQLRSLVQAYQAEKGQWPPDKPTALGLLPAPPRFQCPGNDVDYDPARGGLRLTITDASRC